MIVNFQDSWGCSIVKWILSVPWLADCWVGADCAVQAHLSELSLFFPELDLSPYPVIEAVIERTRLRPVFRLVMGFA